jgi:hypothetical protein
LGVKQYLTFAITSAEARGEQQLGWHPEEKKLVEEVFPK